MKMNVLTQLFQQKLSFKKQINVIGLSIFRIVWSCVLLAEVFRLFFYRHLIFDNIPYLMPYETSPSSILLLWIFVILFLIFGYMTRLFTVINYVISVSFFGTMSEFSYHMFYLFLSVNFLLIFLPVHYRLSIDALLTKYPLKVSQWAYFLPILLGIGFVYFDSSFHKFYGQNWLNGLGFWIPSVIPSYARSDISFLLNHEMLVSVGNWFIVLFEALFIFIFWIKRCRLLLFILGISLHVIIIVAYPLTIFSLGVCTLYLLLIPTSFWTKVIYQIGKYFPKKIPVFVYKLPYFSLKNSIPNYLIFSSILVVFCLLQLNVSIQSWLRYQPINTKTNKLYYYSLRFVDVTRLYFGVTHHDVYIFDLKESEIYLFAVKYNNEFLPIITEKGMPDAMLTGPIWIHWVDRISGVNPQKNKLEEASIRFSAFWAEKMNISLENSNMSIWVKAYKYPNEWHKDKFEMQQAIEWKKVGNLHWRKKRPQIDLYAWDQLIKTADEHPSRLSKLPIQHRELGL